MIEETIFIHVNTALCILLTGFQIKVPLCLNNLSIQPQKIVAIFLLYTTLILGDIVFEDEGVKLNNFLLKSYQSRFELYQCCQKIMLTNLLAVSIQ